MNKKADWKKLVSEQASSGESVAEFCRTRGISDSALNYWRSKLKEKSNKDGFVLIWRF